MLCSSATILRSAVVAATILAASNALAEQLLFDQVSPGGTLSYNGAGGPLIGTDLVFENITGVGTPLNSGATLTLTDGRLNFSTGGNTSEPGALYSWAAGGTFVLTADSVQDAGSSDVVTPGDNVVLLSGTFTAAMNGFVVFNQIIVGGGGIDGKNSQLLDYFGLGDGTFQFVTTAIGTLDLDPATEGFTASVSQADISNTFLIPEPTGIYLLGIALAAFLNFAGWRRRRA